MSAQPIPEPKADSELTPRANEEYNRVMNWQRAAQLEREERGNLFWWRTK